MSASATEATAGSTSDVLRARLERLVAIPSLSKQEADIASTVAEELNAAGIEVRRSGNNIWCEIGDAAKPRLLLNSHLDTVPPGDGWTGDPWIPRFESGRITALGANDAKGCVSAMIEAVLATKAALNRGERLGGTVVLALTAEEENSGAGLSTIVHELGRIHAAIVGEPTNLTPMTAQRGLLIVQATARGRSSHPANTPSDTPHNAIMNAADDLSRLREFDWGGSHPLLGRCHAHVTMINGGVAKNVVPDRCEFWLDIRTTPLESHKALFARLKTTLKSHLHIHSERLVPIYTDNSARIVRAVLRAVPDTVPSGSSAMSDMVFLSGLPAVKIGPGHSPRSHTPDEFILESELVAGAAAYERIIRAYFAETE